MEVSCGEGQSPPQAVAPVGRTEGTQWHTFMAMEHLPFEWDYLF
jgi:hypothetical protein